MNNPTPAKMPQILLSIKPQWCELIAIGKKTIEVRKVKPKCNVPFKVFIYETKDTKHRYMNVFHENTIGKVIGEFVCDEIIEVDCDSCHPFNKATREYINEEVCFDRDVFWQYTKGYCAYGWHISNLVIYDKPKNLNDYHITRAPQSYCYVEEE